MDATEALKAIYNKYVTDDEFLEDDRLFSTVEKALEKQAKDEFDLRVFKLAYEWKCNGVKGSYEEVLEQAKNTVKGWLEIGIE